MRCSNQKEFMLDMSSYQQLFFHLRLACVYSKYLLQWTTIFFITHFNLYSITTLAELTLKCFAVTPWEKIAPPLRQVWLRVCITSHILSVYCSQCSQDEGPSPLTQYLHKTKNFSRLLATLSFHQNCSVRLGMRQIQKCGPRRGDSGAITAYLRTTFPLLFIVANKQNDSVLWMPFDDRSYHSTLAVSDTCWTSKNK